ncbi:MAG TPA: threonine synthase, partial [Blastocatellia bacterium]|nr:threonine synthase [Blastocatellia bacterium]
MSYVKGLKCRECGAPYPVEPLAICEECFGPLEVDYDYEAIGRVLTREAIASRPRTLWRYRELLPLEGEPTVGRHTGCTPLVRAERLGSRLGVRELYIKND